MVIGLKKKSPMMNTQKMKKSMMTVIIKKNLQATFGVAAEKEKARPRADTPPKEKAKDSKAVAMGAAK